MTNFVKTYACADCGTEISSNSAVSTWNAGLQRWETSDADGLWCEQCDNEVNGVEVPMTACEYLAALKDQIMWLEAGMQFLERECHG